jgi:hypothetical protein
MTVDPLSPRDREGFLGEGTFTKSLMDGSANIQWFDVRRHTVRACGVLVQPNVITDEALQDRVA